jgi:2-C-methyl-D-erythritol 2,4-cyclodiphosphate synthase
MSGMRVPEYRTAIGQDSHRFVSEQDTGRPLMLAGVLIPDAPGLLGNSDADVVLHAVTNAVSGITGVNILGEVSDRMCLEEGISDSAAYLAEALRHMGGFRPVHLSVSVEAARPRLAPHIDKMKARLAGLLSLDPDRIGLTATTGEGLTDFGRGLGIQVFCVLTAVSDSPDEG